MAAELTIRAYNVRFGDAILVSVPDRRGDGTETIRHILVDFGNVLRGKAGGGADHVFEPVLSDIQAQLDGKPLDLLVMTHEHMDHVQGLPFGASLDQPIELSVEHAWLTASAAEDYYEVHPEAKKRRLQMTETYDRMEMYLTTLRAANVPIPAAVSAMMLNNSPYRTADCVEYLRNLATLTSYVHREAEPQHGFDEVEFDIWAPEEDTTAYYGRFRPLALDVTEPTRQGAKPTLNDPVPPSGVDAGTFYSLLEARRSGFLDNLLAIDRANNNTSVVFTMTWRGWTLLFAGDAEIRSWKTMHKHHKLGPVDFLKISHHGSHNGTPSGELLDAIFPERSAEQRYALLSTHDGTYNNVPDRATLQRLEDRGIEITRVDDTAGDGDCVEMRFAGRT